MATFTLLITQSPFDSQAPYSSLQFAQAAIRMGHVISGIFFYQAGVQNANSFQATHSDEINMYDHWCEFSKQHSVPLQVCVTAANRRGVINAEDAKEVEGNHFNLRAPFDEVGLGELVALMQQSDRTIQF